MSPTFGKIILVESEASKHKKMALKAIIQAKKLHETQKQTHEWVTSPDGKTRTFKRKTT